MSTNRNVNLPLILPDVVLDNIISFLSESQSAKINKKYYDIAAIKAKKKIVRSMRSARVKMYTIMDNELPCTTNLMRAHYILHYPEEYRSDFFTNAMLHLNNVIYRSNTYRDLRTDRFKHLVETINQRTVKNRFRTLISMMTMEEILFCGW